MSRSDKNFCVPLDRITARFAGIIVYKTAAEIITIAVVDENERYLERRSIVRSADILSIEGTEAIVAAIRAGPVVSRIGLKLSASWATLEEMANRLVQVAPICRLRPAKETAEDFRPILNADFDTNIGFVGVARAKGVLDATLKNAPVEDLPVEAYALAAEVWEERFRKAERAAKRKGYKLPKEPARLSETDELRKRVAELEALVDQREKAVAA